MPRRLEALNPRQQPPRHRYLRKPDRNSTRSNTIVSPTFTGGRLTGRTAKGT